MSGAGLNGQQGDIHIPLVRCLIAGLRTLKPLICAGVERYMADCQLPLLLNADETAVLLRTSRMAVYAMAARSQLPGVTRIGRRLLIRSDALLDWLNQKREPSLGE
jgi:excisionase family DNA binding protein